MTALLLLLVCISGFAFVSAVTQRADKRQCALSRLLQLSEAENNDVETSCPPHWEQEAAALSHLADRLGRAGYYSRGARQLITVSLAVAVIISTLLSGVVGVKQFSMTGGILCALLGIYCSMLGSFLFLRFQTADFEREVLYRIPLFLEALVLLVESGLGLLPALEKIVNAKNSDAQTNPVIFFFRLVYQFSSHGMEFGKALEIVGNATHIKALRHVLLHLDVSATEGSGIVSALRALSSQSHTEWKLSVESRVRRLENLVVFPVFISVLGLMLLTAAVPIIPILELKDSMNSQQQLLSAPTLHHREEFQ